MVISLFGLLVWKAAAQCVTGTTTSEAQTPILKAPSLDLYHANPDIPSGKSGTGEGFMKEGFTMCNNQESQCVICGRRVSPQTSLTLEENWADDIPRTHAVRRTYALRNRRPNIPVPRT